MFLSVDLKVSKLCSLCTHGDNADWLNVQSGLQSCQIPNLIGGSKIDIHFSWMLLVIYGGKLHLKHLSQINSVKPKNWHIEIYNISMTYDILLNNIYILQRWYITQQTFTPTIICFKTTKHFCILNRSAEENI